MQRHAAAAAALLELGAEEFRACFNRRPFRVRHRLADHPLFDLRRLVELGRRLPGENVQYTGAEDIPIGTPLYQGLRTKLSIEETIRQIEECGSWMVLKNVEIDPEYRALLDACLDEIGALSEPIYPGMRQREGFIFISSPSAVTPFHMDPEHNFLLQIRGKKDFHIWTPLDRSVVTEVQLEEYFAGSERQLPYREEYEPKSSVFTLAPGDGLHVPVATPHWLRNGPEVSISFSITFRSQRSERQQDIHLVNRRLRRLGVTPSPYGASAWRDAAKYGAVAALRGFKRGLAGLTPGRRS